MSKELSQHFILQEFVPKEIYSVYKEQSIWFINPQIVVIAELLREFSGKPITINNWHTGGNFNYCGYRPPDCTVGAKYSQHKRGCAIDCHSELTPAQLLEIIKEHWSDFNHAGLTTVENILSTKTWLHCDTRWTDSDELLIVNP